MVRSFEKIMADVLQVEVNPLQGLDLDTLVREMYRRGRQDGYDTGYDEGYKDGVEVTEREIGRRLNWVDGP